MRSEPPPFKYLEDLNASPKVKGDALVKQGFHIMMNGWERWGVTMPSLRPPIDWKGGRGSFDYSLHAWEPLTILIPAYELSRDEQLYEFIRDFVKDWLIQVQKPLLGNTRRSIDEILAQTNRDAWYDMAVGQRIYRLAYMRDLISRKEPESINLIALMASSLEFHHTLLCEDKFFAANSNHGLYQVLGQMAAARRFSDSANSKRYLGIAEERLQRLLDGHFLESGVHKEHSPGYHYMVLGSLTGAISDEVVQSADFVSFIGRMERTLYWMMQPDRGLATFGDSDPRLLPPSSHIAARLIDRVLHDTMLGAEPDYGMAGSVQPYYDAGYAFARMFAPDVEQKFENASYLAQMAAFHSRVHKHADHLTFIWYDRGCDILIDPGRYAYAGRSEIGSDFFNQGFWYSDPKRVYVESTRAHNCVEIDDRSYPRRNVKPWGSALRYAGEQNGLAVTHCEVTHLRSVRHRRVLIMGPGQFLLVVDWLHDRAAAHDYRQWFQLAPDWQAESAGDGYIVRLATAPGRPQQEATYTSDLIPQATEQPAAATESISIFHLIEGNRAAAPVQGQEEPRLQGWMSDAAYSLIPCTSLCIEAVGQNSGRFATLFVFGEATVDRLATRFNATMRNGTIAWQDNKGLHTLKLAMLETGQVDVAFTTISR